MIEGLDPKINNLENVAKGIKSNKYACGGTAKEGYVFLQGDHRDTIKDTLVKMGFAESSIELTLEKDLVKSDKLLQATWNSICSHLVSVIFGLMISIISSGSLCGL